MSPTLRSARPAARSRVPSPVTRSAVSGSSSASADSAPRAWAIERISSQWPSSMIVMRVASSHQISTSNSAERAGPAGHERDQDGQRDQGHHPGLAIGSSPRAPRRKTSPPYRKTIGAEDGRRELDPRDCRKVIAEPGRDVVTQQHDRDGQHQGQPELVAEHGHRVALVPVVARGGHVVAGARHVVAAPAHVVAVRLTVVRLLIHISGRGRARLPARLRRSRRSPHRRVPARRRPVPHRAAP